MHMASASFSRESLSVARCTKALLRVLPGGRGGHFAHTIASPREAPETSEWAWESAMLRASFRTMVKPGAVLHPLLVERPGQVPFRLCPSYTTAKYSALQSPNLVSPDHELPKPPQSQKTTQLRYQPKLLKGAPGNSAPPGHPRSKLGSGTSTNNEPDSSREVQPHPEQVDNPVPGLQISSLIVSLPCSDFCSVT